MIRFVKSISHGLVLCLIICCCPTGRSVSSLEINVQLGDIAPNSEADGIITRTCFLNYTLTDEAAIDLRLKVLEVYDGTVSPFVKNNRIDAMELKYSETSGYIADIEKSLSGVVFVAGKIIAIDPLNENNGEPITIDAIGFAGEDPWNSTVPINIHMYLEINEAQTSGEVGLNQTPFFNALYDTLPDPWDGNVSGDYDDIEPESTGTIYFIIPVVALIAIVLAIGIVLYVKKQNKVPPAG
jgi:hypothetical protein